MTLMDYCMQYIGEIMDGKRAAPEGVTLTETDPMRRSLELMQKAGDIPTLVRMCAAQDSTEIPQEVFDSFDPESLTQLAGEGDAAPEEPEQPQEPDPDAGKHAFQVLLDCVALDDGLVQYLTQVLRDRDWAGFYKLSQITTKMDLNPEEFLFWLGNKELWADDEERACAAVMDACMERLRQEGRLELMAALLSDPELLILDEPLSGLDPINTDLFKGIIREEIEAGKYLIMSSHQMATVEEFCTDLTILDRSRTVLQGHLNDIKKGYGRVHLQLKTEEDAGPYIAESGAQIVTRKEFEYQLKVTSQEQANDLLARLTRAGVPVVLFNLREPSLHEIFVETVGGESDA